ncbi:MAG: hypothetical protein H6Q70_1319 [Firmicutes bacterium]|nr:hypothetical protein [Bacillota bacterium]
MPQIYTQKNCQKTLNHSDPEVETNSFNIYDNDTNSSYLLLENEKHSKLKTWGSSSIIRPFEFDHHYELHLTVD